MTTMQNTTNQQNSYELVNKDIQIILHQFDRVITGKQLAHFLQLHARYADAIVTLATRDDYFQQIFNDHSDLVDFLKGVKYQPNYAKKILNKALLSKHLRRITPDIHDIWGLIHTFYQSYQANEITRQNYQHLSQKVIDTVLSERYYKQQLCPNSCY